MLLVIGGYSRNCGKTMLAETIIEATRDARWLAFKVSPHQHGESVQTTTEPDQTDTGRYLNAGAIEATLLSGISAHEAAAIIEPHIASRNVIVESNSIVDVLKPDLFLLVADFTINDLKPSAIRMEQLADAIVINGGTLPARLNHHRVFNKGNCEELIGFVQSAIGKSTDTSSTSS